ncbi:MAG TPA: type II toxin-antitoxin system RelE/ParE family toxin [Verrucomicrobiae bacterium]|nr:type II toxin-antitoxin system RelE/ParE family toxin [Verrucomicrobiae bacterium]
MAMDIETWKTGSGRDPVATFIRKLSDPEHEQVLHALDDLKALGTYLYLREDGILRKMSDIPGVSELRIKTVRGPIRIFLVFKTGKAVLIEAIYKKSQKTPSKTIKLIKYRAKEVYL